MWLIVKNTENTDICNIIEINDILKSYKILRWSKDEIKLGQKTHFDKVFKLSEVLMHKDVNVRMALIYYHDEKFYEVEISYKFYFIKDGKKILYNQSNTDLLYDIYKSYCFKKYLKVLKRIRSLVTHLLLQREEDRPVNYIDVLRERFAGINASKLKEIRNSLKKNAYGKFKEMSSQIARIDAAIIVQEYELWDKFGFTETQFKILYLPHGIEEKRKMLNETIKKDSLAIFKNYISDINNMFKINLLANE